MSQRSGSKIKLWVGGATGFLGTHLVRVLKAEGNLQVFMANLRYFKESLEKLRPVEARS